MSNKNYIESLFNLKNRIAVVTGGMGKLGAQFTETLARAHCRVAVFDVADKPNEKISKLAKNYPVIFIKIDITNEKNVARAFKAVEKKWGVPTILINNAGWKASPNDPNGAGKPFEKYNMELWNKVFDVNITAAAICSKIMGGQMIKNKKKGVIINVASHYALVAPDQRIYDYRKKSGKEKFVKDASYGASKAALIALTRDLSVQWAKYGIRVVSLAPGGVFNPKSDKEFVENYSSHVPLGRMAEVDEYNGAILFLASEASSYMTGNCLVMDGGWTTW